MLTHRFLMTKKLGHTTNLMLLREVDSMFVHSILQVLFKTAWRQYT